MATIMVETIVTMVENMVETTVTIINQSASLLAGDANAALDLQERSRLIWRSQVNGPAVD